MEELMSTLRKEIEDNLKERVGVNKYAVELTPSTAARPTGSTSPTLRPSASTSRSSSTSRKPAAARCGGACPRRAGRPAAARRGRTTSAAATGTCHCALTTRRGARGRWRTGRRSASCGAAAASSESTFSPETGGPPQAPLRAVSVALPPRGPLPAERWLPLARRGAGVSRLFFLQP